MRARIKIEKIDRGKEEANAFSGKKALLLDWGESIACVAGRLLEMDWHFVFSLRGFSVKIAVVFGSRRLKGENKEIENTINSAAFCHEFDCIRLAEMTVTQLRHSL